MVEGGDGGSAIHKGRRGKKKRGNKKGHLMDKGNSNDGPHKQQQQQQRFPVVSDPRFASMHSAPTFQRSKPDDRKVELDDRFKAVLTDPRFQVSDAKVDKYGRRVKKASRGAEKQLRAFYKVEGKDGQEKEKDDDDEEENDYDDEEEGDGGLDEEGMGEGFEADGGVMTAGKDSRQVYLTKLSRGEISVSSSDDSSTSSDEEEHEASANSDDESDAGVIGSSSLGRGREEADIPVLSKESSRRLAVTNCDWDHLRARDLMVLCGSFCPSSARLCSVRVYPSDFGLEMMKLETAAGPHAVLSGGKSEMSTHEDSDEADSSMDEDELEDDDQLMGGDGDDEGGGDKQEGSGGDSAGDVESETEAEGGGGVGISTSAGVAVDGRVVRRRRPGVIIEEYRGATVSSGDEGDEGEPVDFFLVAGASTKKIAMTKKRSKELQELEGEDGGGGGSEGAGFDPEKLRAYELRKLKYYFAMLEFSSAVAAEAVYREVDGMEFEHSAVALDLRFVPDDVSFEGRTVRDSCTSVPSSYQPPTFICKALQQTRVECTWDEVPGERQVLLGRTSQWRDAAEEDFEAYLATSSEESDDSSHFSDDDDNNSDLDSMEDDDTSSKAGGDEGGANATGGNNMKDNKQKNKKLLSAAAARRARKVLLGDALGSDAASGSDEEESEDDYEDGVAAGTTEVSSPSKASLPRGIEDEAEAGNAEFTFVPRGKKKGGDQEGGGVETLLVRKKQRDALAKETPWEASLRRERERKKARKRALKERSQEGGDAAQGEDDFFLEEVLPGGDAGNAAAPGEGVDRKGSNPEDERGAYNSSDQEDEKEEERRDYDMHRLAREEKLKGKKLRGKRKRKEMAREKAPGQDFTVDVKDERFAAVLEGDTRFGIDRTDASFKDTEGMRQILEERARRRDQRQENPSEVVTTTAPAGDPANGIDESLKAKGELSSLVKKLKNRGLGGGEKRDERVGGKETVHGSGDCRHVNGGKDLAVLSSIGGENVSGARKGRRGKKKRRKG